jgi:hypothetical protein
MLIDAFNYDGLAELVEFEQTLTDEQMRRWAELKEKFEGRTAAIVEMNAIEAASRSRAADLPTMMYDMKPRRFIGDAVGPEAGIDRADDGRKLRNCRGRNNKFGNGERAA